MIVRFHDLNDVNHDLKFVVVQARYKGKWIYVKHKERNTWEIPGGHIEANESIEESARRELWEESGAIDFKLIPLCDYSVDRPNDNYTKSYGRLFFAEVEELGDIPESEIGEVMLNETIPSNLTYEKIQPYLYERVLDELKRL